MARHLYVHNPPALVTGRIGGSFDPDTDYPVGDIPITSVVGDIPTSVREGMTVIFGSAAGLDDLGRQRIRRAADNSELYIGYSPKGRRDGEIDIQPNDHFTILGDYRVWAKTQRFIFDPEGDPVVTPYKDYDLIFASYGQGSLFFPKANAGPPRAGTIDPDTGVLTVPLNGGHSYSLESTIVGYLWDVGDGTITTGTETDSAIVVEFPPGFRYVTLTVTDDDDLEHTTVVPIYARDPDNDTTVPVWQSESLQHTAQGTQFNVRILSDLPRATYPDGTLVLMWDDANEDVRCEFAGWHHSDRASLAFVRTGALRDTVLECFDVAAKLGTLPGQSQVVEQADAPTLFNWSQMVSPSMYKLIDYLLRWHSTALEVADFEWPDEDADLGFVVRESSAGTLLAQVDEQARAIVPDHTLHCSRHGELLLVADPNLQPLADRPTTVQANLTGKIASLRVSHSAPPRVHWIRGGAVLAGTSMVTPSIEVDYTLVVDGSYAAGVTELTMEPLPVAIPSGATIYLVGQIDPFATTTAPASQSATTLYVTETSTLINNTYDLKYTATEDGPPYIPTIFCIAPGRVPGQGATAMTINNKIAASQAALNDAIGHLYAAQNAPYGVVEIDLVGEDDLGIDPALPAWIEIGNFAPRYVPQRDLPIYRQAFDYLFLPLEVTERWTHDKRGATKHVSIRAVLETWGGPATTVTGDEI